MFLAMILLFLVSTKMDGEQGFDDFPPAIQGIVVLCIVGMCSIITLIDRLIWNMLWPIS